MRAALLILALTGVGCGGASPAAPVGDTGLVLTILYSDTGSLTSFEVDGSTAATARHFGVYKVASKQLPSGGTLGFVFDPEDAGSAMICVTALDDDHLQASGCGLFEVRAGEVVRDTLTLVND